MRQDNETLSVRTRDDITGASQATSDRLPYPTQTRISRVPAKNFKVGGEVVQRERHQRQLSSLPFSNRPIVLKYISKCASIQKACDRVIA